MGEFRMPSLGADMESGTVVEWLVQPGDTVHKGDVVVVVETEKATIEAEVFEDGIVDALVVDVGQEADVGTVLATLRSPDAAAPAPAEPELEPPAPEPDGAGLPESHAVDQHHDDHGAHVTHSPLVRRLADDAGLDLADVEGTGTGGAITRADVESAIADRLAEPAASSRSASVPAASAAPEVPTPAVPTAVVPATASGRVKASPLARRRAEAEGIDLHQLHGTGPGGAVVAADLTAPAPASAAPGPAPAAARRPGSPTSADGSFRRRQALGTLMARSKREIPHYYLSTTIEVGDAVARLRAANERRAVADRLLPAAVLLWATARAAAEVPVMNGHWRDGAFEPSDAVHLGVAISLRGGGLVAPAMRDAGSCSVEEVMARLRDLVGRARTGALRTSELSDPTITVTNLGDQGVDAVYGVIYPPQVAIVGFGKVVDRPWAIDGMLAVRPVLTATLSADHRASDGHDGARFLTALSNHLKEPELP